MRFRLVLIDTKTGAAFGNIYVPTSVVFPDADEDACDLVLDYAGLGNKIADEIKKFLADKKEE